MISDAQSLSKKVAKILFPQHDLKQAVHMKKPELESEMGNLEVGHSKPSRKGFSSMDMADQFDGVSQ